MKTPRTPFEPLAPVPGSPAAHRRHGRRAPYTALGIRRVPCYRCGQPAQYQWQVCADDRLFRPLCLDCDIDLNRVVLRWMKDPEAESKLARYELEKRSDSQAND